MPETYSRLVENMHLNHLDERVWCVNKAIGAVDGVVHFTRDSDTTNHVLPSTHSFDNTIPVDVTTLDNALNGEAPTLIKIDVEGYESSVMEGAKDVLENDKLNVVLMELNGSGERYGFDESQLLRKMKHHGFREYTYEPFQRKLIAVEGAKSNANNILFIRNNAFVEDRLQSGAKVTLNGIVF